MSETESRPNENRVDSETTQTPSKCEIKNGFEFYNTGSGQINITTKYCGSGHNVCLEGK